MFLEVDSPFFATIVLFKKLFSQGFGWSSRKIRIPGFRMEMEATLTMLSRALCRRLGDVLAVANALRGQQWKCIDAVKGLGVLGAANTRSPSLLGQ